MKLFGLMLVLVLGSSLAQASTLLCLATPYGHNGTVSRGGQHVDDVVAHCVDFASGRYAKVDLHGLGPSWRLALVDVFAVACPSVPYEQLGGTYKGIRLEGDLVVGLRLAMYTPDNQKACYVPGLKALSIGGSLTRGEMNIQVVGATPTPTPTPAPTPAPTATPVPTPTPPPPTIR